MVDQVHGVRMLKIQTNGEGQIFVHLSILLFGSKLVQIDGTPTFH